MRSLVYDSVIDGHATPDPHVGSGTTPWAAASLVSASIPASGPSEPERPAHASDAESARTAAEFESAMADVRTWSATDYRAQILADPGRGPVARRLIWVTLDAAGRVLNSVRPHADGSARDHRGRPVGVDGTRIAVAHPLHLGADIPHWARDLAEDGVTQPFDQIHRAVYRLGPDEAAATSLTRFADRMVATDALLRLEDSGWRRSAPADGGIHDYLFRPVGADLQVLIVLDDGIDAGDPLLIPEQVLAAVELTARPARSWMHRCGDTRFAVLDPVTASEILRDLETLVG